MKVTIVGAGPAGLFAALELAQINLATNSGIDIEIVDCGKDLEERSHFFCPMDSISEERMCKKCFFCNRLCGFGGAGGYSDGKLNLIESIGGDISKLRKEYSDFAYTREYVLQLLLDIFPPFRNEYLLKAKANNHGTIIHFGTDGCFELIRTIRKWLIENGVKITLGTKITKIPDSDYVIFAVGRVGNSDLKYIFGEDKIEISSADIGIRIELPYEYTKHLTDKWHEFKFRTTVHGLNIRTFCVNPRGFVTCERIHNVLSVNGHSYKKSLKSKLTNFAVLANISIDDAVDTNEYVLNVGRTCAAINKRGVVTQRLLDFLLDKKTPQSVLKEAAFSKIQVSFAGDCGNLNMILPFRIAASLKEAIKIFAKDIPNIYNDDVWVHGVEMKCYSNRVKVDPYFKVEGYDNVYCIGDGSGWTRGLMQSMMSGILAAQSIEEKLKESERKIKTLKR